jgi:tetratricopeptide (TPR) repeat protein
MKKLLTIVTLTFSSLAISQNDTIQKVCLQDKANEFISVKDFQGASKIYTKMIELFPEDLRLIHDRAIVYMMSGDYQNAIPDFTKLITENYSDIAESYYFRGLCRISLSDYPCEDLLKAKVLGYTTDWNNLKLVCTELTTTN